MKSVLKFTKFSTNLHESFRTLASLPNFNPKAKVDLHKSFRTLASLPNFNPKAKVDESPIFLQTKFRRPPTVKLAYQSLNSCRLIGTVIRPVKMLSLKYAYTFLQVNMSCLGSGSDSSFKILLAMCNHLAEVSSKYLKPDDYICVKGMLSSYTKMDDSGKSEVLYKVLVDELNYVRNLDTNEINQKTESANANSTATTSCNIDDEKALSSNDSDWDARKRDRLLLWQVFFANPNEWWDNRHNKPRPKIPDFKHKDTRECLWLYADDPPWIKKQLQRYDSYKVREAEIYNNKSAGNNRSLDDFL